LAPSSLNWTDASVALSPAPAETVVVPETVEPDPGAVSVSVGAVWSPLESENAAVLVPATTSTTSAPMMSRLRTNTGTPRIVFMEFTAHQRLGKSLIGAGEPVGHRL
jgi:hypothetical protein